MTTTTTIPLPGDHVDGGIVIASVHYRELVPGEKLPGDDWPDLVYLVMLLEPEPMYYRIAYITPDWEVLLDTRQPNIVPATATYVEWGGEF